MSQIARDFADKLRILQKGLNPRLVRPGDAAGVTVIESRGIAHRIVELTDDAVEPDRLQLLSGQIVTLSKIKIGKLQ